MQVRVPENKNEKIGSCGCGRSPTGDCCGWHALTEDQYRVAKEKWIKEDSIRNGLVRG